LLYITAKLFIDIANKILLVFFPNVYQTREELPCKYETPLVCGGNYSKRAQNTHVKVNEAEIFLNARHSAMSLMLISSGAGKIKRNVKDKGNVG